jgi:ankyrin repeat protein
MQSRLFVQQYEPGPLFDDNTLVKIISYLNPEDVAHLRLLNKHFSQALQGNAYWKAETKRHFHADYKKFKNRQNVDWFSLFKRYYYFCYRNLSAPILKIISLVHSGDISGLDQLNLSYDDLFWKCYNDSCLWEVIASTRNQPLMDHFFKKLVKPYYNIRDSKNEIFDLFSIVISFNQTKFFNKHWLDIRDEVAPTFTSSDIPFLHNAAKHGYVSFIHSLINFNFDVDSLAYKRTTPLELAVRSGRADAVEALFGWGASRENLGHLIHLAAQSGHYRTFKAIEETGVSFYTLHDDGSTLLHSAVCGRNIKIVNAIFEKMKDVQVDAVDASGRTPLHLAAEYGCVDIFNQLLLSGASILKTTNNGDSVLHCAANGREPAIVSLIMDKNIFDINMKNLLGETPLHCVFWCEYRFNHEIIDILIRAGADVNAVTGPSHEDFEGKETPLHYAVFHEDSVGIEKLLSAGADVNAVSQRGKPPIFYAVDEVENHTKAIIFNKLVEAGAGVNIKMGPYEDDDLDEDDDDLDESCVTLLHQAVSCGNLRMVERLLEAKANVCAVDEFGHTPLHMAVFSKNTAIVKALLAAGSQVDLVTKSKKTPFDLCVKSGNFQHVSAFVERDIKFNPDVLKNLKELKFSKVSMSADALAVVLTGASHLKTLNLEGMKILPSSPNFSLPENVSFPYLTSIDVSFDDLSVLPVLKAILKASPAVEKVGSFIPLYMLNMSSEMRLAFYNMYKEVFESHKHPYAGKVLAGLYENGRKGIFEKKLHDAKAIYAFLRDQDSVDRVQKKINEMLPMRVLVFSDFFISVDALAVVLTRVSDLKTLDISRMKILPSSSNFSLPENVSFSYLTSIDVSFDDLSVLPVLKAILKASPAVEEVGGFTAPLPMLKMSAEMRLTFYNMCQEVFESHKNPYAGKVLAAFYENGCKGICKKKLHDAKAIYDLLGDQVSMDRVQGKINEMWVNGLFATPAKASEKRPSDGCDSPSKRQKK